MRSPYSVSLLRHVLKLSWSTVCEDFFQDVATSTVMSNVQEKQVLLESFRASDLIENSEKRDHKDHPVPLWTTYFVTERFRASISC